MAVVVGTAQGKLTLDASKFLSSIESAYKSLKSFNDLIEDTNKALKNLPKSVNLNVNGGTGGSGGGLIPTVPEFPEEFPERVKKSTDSVNLLNEALSTGLTGAIKTVGSIAEVTFKAFEQYTKFIVDFSKQSLQVGLQFDATMSQVSAISGATGEDFDLLREKALEMGAQTKFSASEAGQAMVYMGMAGWKTEQIMDGLAGVMSLAAASGEDLATTSDIVTDALTAFGLGAEDATRFADVLAAASTNSNTNVALMGETFKYVAPLAGTMKYSIEDTAVAIGLMANNGIKGSQAGTALRNVISNLVKPPKQAAAAMAELGISLTDAEGNNKSLMEVMKDLRQAFGDISNDESLQSYKTYMDGLNADLEAGLITQEEYETSAEAMAQQFLKSTDSMKAALASAISGKFGLSGLLAIVNASEEDFEALTAAIYGASDGMGAAAQMEEKMMDNLQGSMTIFKSTLETFQITISDILKGPANEIVKFGQESIATMTTALAEEGIPGLIKSIGTILPKGVAEIVKYIPEILPTLVQGFWTLVNGLIDAIPEAFPTIVDAAFELFLGLIQGLVNATNRLIDVLPEALGYVTKALLDNAPAILDAAIELFLNIVEAVIVALPDIIKATVGLIKDIVKALHDHLGDILKAGIELFLALIEGLTDPDTIQDLILAIGEIISVIMDTFGEVDWLDVADKIFSGLGKGLLGIFQGALGAIDELLGTSFADWGKEVAGYFTYLKQQSFEFGKSLANSMQKTEIELNTLAGQYDSTWHDMLDMYSNLVQQGMERQEALARAYQDYFQSAEAQYVFRERFAGQLTQGSIAEAAGLSGLTNQQLVDILGRAQATTGNTYNFYTNEPIDERKAADEIRRVNEDILQGE